MSIAFIGVQRLVTKVVNTCSAFYEPKDGLFSSYSSNTSYPSLCVARSEFIKVNPSTHSSNPNLVREQIEINGGSQPYSSFAPKSAAIPLRVMRVVDQGCAPNQAGRMVMSGRFADVCAELDRLAERQDNQLSIRK